MAEHRVIHGRRNPTSLPVGISDSARVSIDRRSRHVRGEERTTSCSALAERTGIPQLFRRNGSDSRRPAPQSAVAPANNLADSKTDLKPDISSGRQGPTCRWAEAELSMLAGREQPWTRPLVVAHLPQLCVIEDRSLVARAACDAESCNARRQHSHIPHRGYEVRGAIKIAQRCFNTYLGTIPSEQHHRVQHAQGESGATNPHRKPVRQFHLKGVRIHAQGASS